MRLVLFTLAALAAFMLFAAMPSAPPPERPVLRSPVVDMRFPPDQAVLEFTLIPRTEVRVVLPEPSGRVVALGFVRLAAGPAVIYEEYADGDFHATGLGSEGLFGGDRRWCRDYSPHIEGERVVLVRVAKAG